MDKSTPIAHLLDRFATVTHNVAFASLIAFALPAGGQTSPDAKAIRAFHVGNSLTFGVISDPQSKAFLSSRGVPYEFGFHVLWGNSLASIWEKADAPSDKDPKYGTFKEALANYEWDVLTLQPWQSRIEGACGDLEMAKKYIALAREKSPDVQAYIYETWPGKDATGQLDFAAKWIRPDAEADESDMGVYNSRYCPELVGQLNADLAGQKKPVKLIPVGSVLFELDKAMKAGKVIGLEKVDQLYRDEIHMGPLGAYVGRCTFFAVIRRENPKGLPGPEMFKAVPADFAAAVQEAVWAVVQPSAESR